MNEPTWRTAIVDETEGFDGPQYTGTEADATAQADRDGFTVLGTLADPPRLILGRRPEGRYTHLVRRESGYVAGWFRGEPPAEFVAECNANVPHDPAHVEALDWAAWDRWCEQLEPHGAEHACPQGPLCEQMTRYLDLMGGYAEDPMSAAYGHYPEPADDETDCPHWTCRGIVYQPCEQCQRDAMADYYRDQEAGR